MKPIKKFGPQAIKRATDLAERGALRKAFDFLHRKISPSEMPTAEFIQEQIPILYPEPNEVHIDCDMQSPFVEI